MYNFQVLGVQGSFHTLISAIRCAVERSNTCSSNTQQVFSNRQNGVVFSCARVEYEDGAPCSYHCTASEAVKALILYKQDQNDEAGADWAASREP